MLKVPPGEFAAALGAASLTSNPADQGETLVLGNTCFVKSVSPTEDYRTTSSRATSFSSGFVAGIPPGVRPTAHYGVAGRGQSMESIYKDLARRHGPFFAVTARGHFSRIEASAVKRAPGYGEPILGANKERYFHPSAVMSDVDAFTFGLVLRSPEDATTQTKRIFYINPDDRGTSGMLSHTHFGVLRSLKGVDPANPASAAPQVSEVAHLLTQSIVTSGEFDVYELSDGVR